MSNDKQRTVRFLKTWAINTLAVLIAVKIVPGIHISPTSPYAAPILSALTLGILNAFIRPILMLVALPLVILTLGLFTFVINALLLYLVALLLPRYFQVDTFWAAFLGAAIIWVISGIANLFTGGSRVTVKRWPPSAPPPPGKSGPGKGPDNGPGNGPIIDI